MAEITNQDLEDAIDTIIGEAAGEGAAGMQAVAWAMINRAKNRGRSIGQVVRQPGQFDGWGKPGQAAKAARNDPKIRALATEAITGALTGAIPDPTGGADHFVSGDKTPYWAKDMPKTATVGGHRFYASKPPQATAKAPESVQETTPFKNAQGEAYTQEVKWNGYDKNLKPEVVSVLNNAQQALDFPIVLRSGYRDPARNARVGGAKKSQHLTGDAVDISLRGLNDAQRTELTRALAWAGGKRLGAYSGNTSIHLDMADGYTAPEKYSVFPMFDRSVRNMSQSPDWFKTGLDGTPPRLSGTAVAAIDNLIAPTPQALPPQRLAYAPSSANISVPRQEFSLPLNPPRIQNNQNNTRKPLFEQQNQKRGLVDDLVAGSFDAVSKANPAGQRQSVNAIAPLFESRITPNLNRGDDDSARILARSVDVHTTPRWDSPIGSFMAWELPDDFVSEPKNMPKLYQVADAQYPPVTKRTNTYLAGDTPLPRNVRPNVPKIPQEDLPPLLQQEADRFNETGSFRRNDEYQLPALTPPQLDPLAKPGGDFGLPQQPIIPDSGQGGFSSGYKDQEPIDLINVTGSKPGTFRPADRIKRDNPLEFLPDVGGLGAMKRASSGLANGYGPAGYAKLLARPMWDFFGGGTQVPGPRNNNVDNTLISLFNPGIQSSQATRDQARATGNHSTLKRGDRSYDASTNSWKVK